MKRILMDELVKWKSSKNRLPLILKGARQVGKTWLLKEFGKTAFEDVLYINFENAPGVYVAQVEHPESPRLHTCGGETEHLRRTSS